jgi:hypothetical protein
VGDDQQKDPRLIVESEDQPNRRLLETRIIKDEAFQKQQGMLLPRLLREETSAVNEATNRSLQIR